MLADLRETSPDLVLHGGDLSDNGSSPVEIVDHIRALGWPGVIGNTDEMLAGPQSLADFAQSSPQMQPLLPIIEEMAHWTRQQLGESRLSWLRALPRTHLTELVALVHASPASCWRSPAPESPDADFESVYAPLARKLAVYGHVHRPFIRPLNGMTVVNTGSVGLSYDGDARASYLILQGDKPSICRVEYDIERELKRLRDATLPHHDWIAKTLKSARPQMP